MMPTEQTSVSSPHRVIELSSTSLLKDPTLTTCTMTTTTSVSTGGGGEGVEEGFSTFVSSLEEDEVAGGSAQRAFAGAGRSPPHPPLSSRSGPAGLPLHPSTAPASGDDAEAMPSVNTSNGGVIELLQRATTAIAEERARVAVLSEENDRLRGYLSQLMAAYAEDVKTGSVPVASTSVLHRCVHPLLVEWVTLLGEPPQPWMELESHTVTGLGEAHIGSVSAASTPAMLQRVLSAALSPPATHDKMPIAAAAGAATSDGVSPAPRPPQTGVSPPPPTTGPAQGRESRERGGSGVVSPYAPAPRRSTKTSSSPPQGRADPVNGAEGEKTKSSGVIGSQPPQRSPSVGSSSGAGQRRSVSSVAATQSYAKGYSAMTTASAAKRRASVSSANDTPADHVDARQDEGKVESVAQASRSPCVLSIASNDARSATGGDDNPNANFVNHDGQKQSTRGASNQSGARGKSGEAVAVEAAGAAEASPPSPLPTRRHSLHARHDSNAAMVNRLRRALAPAPTREQIGDVVDAMVSVLQSELRQRLAKQQRQSTVCGGGGGIGSASRTFALVKRAPCAYRLFLGSPSAVQDAVRECRSGAMAASERPKTARPAALSKGVLLYDTTPSASTTRAFATRGGWGLSEGGAGGGAAVGSAAVPTSSVQECTVHFTIDSGRLCVMGGGGHVDFLEYLERRLHQKL